MAKTVEVPDYEIVREVTVDPARTALLVTDMQHDFMDPDGAIPVPGATATIPRIARLLAWARRRGLAVFHTQDTHREGDPEWRIWGRHAERGSHGWQIVPELAPEAGEPVIEKLRYDAFYGTTLDHQLRLRGVESVIVCGTVANICVHYTGSSAGLRWYRVIHPVDCLSALTPFDYEVALRQASFLFQAVLTTSDALVAGG